MVAWYIRTLENPRRNLARAKLSAPTWGEENRIEICRRILSLPVRPYRRTFGPREFLRGRSPPLD